MLLRKTEYPTDERISFQKTKCVRSLAVCWVMSEVAFPIKFLTNHLSERHLRYYVNSFCYDNLISENWSNLHAFKKLHLLCTAVTNIFLENMNVYLQASRRGHHFVIYIMWLVAIWEVSFIWRIIIIWNVIQRYGNHV